MPSGLANLRVGQLEDARLLLVCLHLEQQWCPRELYSKIEAKAVVTTVTAEDVVSVRRNPA
jgi:hypothetical protein